jgi:hypothetical protein
MSRTARKRILAFAAAVAVLLGSVLGPGPASVAAPAVAKPVGETLFRTLAAAVSQAGRLERYDFASIALNELVAAYEGSYRESANEQHANPKARLKLARWRRESKTFIDQLNTLRTAVSDQSLIEIESDQSGPLLLFIDNVPVLISGPEIARAGPMEQRIMQRYCQLHDCERYHATLPTPVLAEVPRVRGGWHLQHRQGASYETGDGLMFVFLTLEDRVEKQARCEAIAADLRLLVGHLQSARQAGHAIDWQQLSIATLHDGITEQIVINDAGVYLNMELGFFGNGRELLPPFRDWIRKRVAGEPASVVIPDAERLIR